MAASRETALVTGGAGFIGSELVRQLSAAGQTVLVLDNLANGRRENLADVPSGNVRLVVGDVRDAGVVRSLLAEASVVYHLACLGVRHSLREPTENHEVNATATLRLLEAAREAGVRRFVHVSSSEVYGTARTAPMSEEHTTLPATVYGASKLAGESYARAFFFTYGFPTVVVRPFNAYGPRCHHEGDSGEVIPKFLLRRMAGLPMIIFGDGAQTRDFTHVSDTAAAIALAGNAAGVEGETLNIGSGQEHSILALAEMISEVAGEGAPAVEFQPPRPGDVRRLVADSSRAQRLLGYAPRMSFAEGLRNLAAWYRQQGVSPEDLLRQEVIRNWEPAA